MIPHINETNDCDEDEFKYQREVKKIKWYDRVLLNRPLKVTLVFLILAVAAPLLIYRYYFFTSLILPPSDGLSVGSCVTSRESRITCGVGFVNEEECHPQCCFDRNLHFCYHRIPSRFSYITDQPWNENITLKARIPTVPYAFQDSLPKLKLSIDERSATHLVMTFYDPSKSSIVGNRINDKDYSYEVSSPEMNIVVNASQGTIFDTARGPLIASGNIWEISFLLTNDSMYGLGELPLNVNTTKIIYNHDDGFSSIPLIYAKVNDSFHGLLFDVSDPTEIFVRGDNQIVVRSITNFGFKFHLFTGPEPEKIMQDVIKIIGYNNQLEYWMLGIHVCNEVNGMDLGSFISNATRVKMPYDSHCGNGPIVFNSDQCKDSEISNINSVNAGATLVKGAMKKFVPHVSPYIRYIKKEINETETTKSCEIIPTFQDNMYRSQRTLDLYKGEINEYEVIYPNYNQDSDELINNLWVYDLEFDGLVLENNWPLDQSNKTHNETANYLPYFSEHFEDAFAHTPQWNLTLVNDTELYLFKHNAYGNNFANTFNKKSSTVPIFSSSLWMNGRFAITRQKVDVSWSNLHKELIAAALGGISGSWLWSSPICGDTENFDPENQDILCVKWYLAGTYLPLIKIYSKGVPRYPFAFSGTYQTIIIQALQRRLSLLPYFYTTLQEGPLLRPMFYQFPNSVMLHDIYTQFSVGNSLLIAPNLQPFQSHVHVWLPPGTWYELWSGLKLEGEEGDPVTMTTADADFLTFIRGGSILFIQPTTETSAEDTRLFIPFSVIIALECAKYNGIVNCQASGKQFITPKLTLLFEANERNFTLKAEGNDFQPICDISTGTWAYDISYFYIYGLSEEYNNFDNHRELKEFVDLCELEFSNEIVVDLI